MSLIVDIEKKLPGFHLKVSFRCGKNTIGLLGSSGAGKSMTLRCIAGLETPTEGYIALEGVVLYDSAKGINLPPQARRAGYLFQNYALFPHLTIAQNIRLGMRALKKNEQARLAEEYIALVRLTGYENRYPAQLSGGQQQRAALARALAGQPRIMLLDEPFSAMDTHLRGELEQQLSSILEKFHYPAIYVTHNLEEAYRLCPELLILHNGRAAAYGPREEIFLRPPAYEAARLTACQNITRARKTGENEIEAVDWNCRLRVTPKVPDNVSHAGIRAHHIRLTGRRDTDNTFPYITHDLAYAPDHVMISFSLIQSHRQANGTDNTLKVKISLAHQQRRERDWPPYAHLPADEIFLMRDATTYIQNSPG